MRIAIVIVNYKSQNLVLACLASLSALGRADLDCIVVDNSPTCDTARIAATHPDVTVIRPGSNLGFAGGCNRGISLALERMADFVLLLNPDTRTEQDFLRPLLEVMVANPRLGATTPTILNDDTAREPWFAGSAINWWLGGPKHQTFTPAMREQRSINVPFLTGCVMLLRSTAIRQAGLMDENYFLYFEDADYSCALRRAGWDLAYVPAAQVLHAPSSTTGFQSESYLYYFSRNRIWFMRRWAQWYQYAVFLSYCTLVKLPGSILIFGLIRGDFHLAKAFIRGYLHGLRLAKNFRRDK